METDELKEEILKGLEHLADQIEYECEISYTLKLAKGEAFSRKSYKNIYLLFLKQAYAMGVFKGNNEGYQNGRDAAFRECRELLQNALALNKKPG